MHFDKLTELCSIEEGIIGILNESIRLPYLLAIPRNRDLLPTRELGLIFGHGLGARNPHEKGYHNDEWAKFILPVSCTIGYPTLLYTARGHGESSGWEETKDSHPEQFTWEYLSADMHEVSTAKGFTKYVATGSSMGSATALYAAIQYPDYVKAVIMIRPPTAWNTRKDHRKTLLSSAKKLKLKEREYEKNYFHKVLEGTAYSDLPSPETEADVYSRIRCPVLILTIEGDDSHPVSTATTVHELVPKSELHIAPSHDNALRDWPQIITNFLTSLT